MSDSAATSATSAQHTEHGADKFIWGSYIALVIFSIIELFSASSQQVRVNDIFKPLPQAENRIFTFSNLVSNGLAVYQGIRMGSSFVHAVLSLFRKKRK